MTSASVREWPTAPSNDDIIDAIFDVTRKARPLCVCLWVSSRHQRADRAGPLSAISRLSELEAICRSLSSRRPPKRWVPHKCRFGD